MQFSEEQEMTLLAMLVLLLLFVVAILWLLGRWFWKLLPPSPPLPPHYVEDVSPAGKWVVLGVVLLMLAGLCW